MSGCLLSNEPRRRPGNQCPRDTRSSGPAFAPWGPPCVSGSAARRGLRRDRDFPDRDRLVVADRAAGDAQERSAGTAVARALAVADRDQAATPMTVSLEIREEADRPLTPPGRSIRKRPDHEELRHLSPPVVRRSAAGVDLSDRHRTRMEIGETGERATHLRLEGPAPLVRESARQANRRAVRKRRWTLPVLRRARRRPTARARARREIANPGRAPTSRPRSARASASTSSRRRAERSEVRAPPAIGYYEAVVLDADGDRVELTA